MCSKVATSQKERKKETKKSYIIQYINSYLKCENRNLLEIKTNKRESKSIQLLNTYIAVVSSHKVSKIVTLYTCAYIHSKSQYYQEG